MMQTSQGTPLLPDVAQALDPVALVIRVVAGKVTVGLEPPLRVAAAEEELLKVTHGSGWSVELSAELRTEPRLDRIEEGGKQLRTDAVAVLSSTS